MRCRAQLGGVWIRIRAAVGRRGTAPSEAGKLWDTPATASSQGHIHAVLEVTEYAFKGPACIAPE